MLTVTEKAAEELKSTLDAVEPEDGQILRLIYDQSSGFGLTLDEEQEGDQIVESAGKKVLLIGSDLADAVDGATIDVRDTDEGPRLTISR